MKKILQKENSILRKVAQEVPIKEIGSAKIKKIIKEMTEALANEPEGVALAAPQIGYGLRLFIVAKHKLSQEENPLAGGEFLIFINPKILKTSQKKVFLKEGCLSLTGIYKEIWRKEKALIEAYDENGKKFRRGASGLLAEIIQHEVDHLNGILFIDKK
ncbi:MAG: Peptide deformylase [Parcubacteria group bacterium GW2011_GWB1_41_6]|nr:MAG: Peptide deformylase [Parcubacteria group bacterium GW2011_GWB1_41_6]